MRNPRAVNILATAKPPNALAIVSKTWRNDILSSDLSVLKNRSGKVTGRGQVFEVLKANGYSIG